MSQRNLCRFVATLLAACSALFAIYYVTTLLLVMAFSPTASTAVLLGGISAQLVACSLGSFLAGRTVWRRAYAASESTQQPMSAPSSGRG